MKELSDGIPAIFLEFEIFKKIKPGAQAVALTPDEGVSFFIIPEFEDQVKHKDFMKKLKRENIPHETQHLIWRYLQKSGFVETTEREDEFRKAFLVYQNELIARLCSKGKMAGYSHLSMLGGEYVKSLDQDLAEEVFKKVRELNGFLEKVEESMSVKPTTKKSDLIRVVLKSKNFKELEGGLKKMKKLLKKEKRVNNKQQEKGYDFCGWGGMQS